MSGERFNLREESFTREQPFRIEELPFVEADNLDAIEAAAIERAIIERETLIHSLQTEYVSIRSERDALETQLSRVESERDDLQERIRQLEIERPSLEPQSVLTSLGSAINEVRADLESDAYTIGDVEFNLKANFIQTDDGLRVHLPSLDETYAAANLSEIAFNLHAAPRSDEGDEEFVEIPDVVGVSQDEADRRLTQAGLTVGSVTAVDAPSEPPGVVIEQFPEAFSLAETNAPVDLTVTQQTESGTATAGGTARETQVLEEFRDAIERKELESGSVLAERLNDAGIESLDELVGMDPDHVVEITELPEDSVLVLHERLLDRLGTQDRPVEDIDGIGPTYAERLRNAGITTIAELAERTAESVAEITESSPNRAREWIKQANALIE